MSVCVCKAFLNSILIFHFPVRSQILVTEFVTFSAFLLNIGFPTLVRFCPVTSFTSLYLLPCSVVFPVHELFKFIVSRGGRSTERAVSAILSRSPPVFPLVRLPNIVCFGFGPSKEVDPRLDVSGISPCNDTCESSPKTLQYYREGATISIGVV